MHHGCFLVTRSTKITSKKGFPGEQEKLLQRAAKQSEWESFEFDSTTFEKVQWKLR